MATGTVKWFNEAKGYGFIANDDGSGDLFVHFSNIAGAGFRTLQDGEPVEFEAAEGRKGPEAINVRPLDGMQGGSQSGSYDGVARGGAAQGGVQGGAQGGVQGGRAPGRRQGLRTGNEGEF